MGQERRKVFLHFYLVLSAQMKEIANGYRFQDVRSFILSRLVFKVNK